MTDIAKSQGVALSTISRYLDTIKPQIANIQRYTRHKADTLALSQLKLQTVSDIIVDSWLGDPDKIRTQDFRTQKEILVAAQGAKTYDFNSERLEIGKSTNNISMLIGQIEDLQRGVSVGDIVDGVDSLVGG